VRLAAIIAPGEPPGKSRASDLLGPSDRGAGGLLRPCPGSVATQ